MSYKDYLRSKVSGIPNIVRVQGGDDASSLTLKKRYIASGLMNNSAGAILPANDLFSGQKSRGVAITTKLSGGKVPDASVYTGFRGHQGVADDSPYLNNYSKETPCNPIPTAARPIIPASDRTRLLKICPSLQGEAEGIPLFVDYMKPSSYFGGEVCYKPTDTSGQFSRPVPQHGVIKGLIPLHVPPIGKFAFVPPFPYTGVGSGIKMEGGVIRKYNSRRVWKHGNPNVGLTVSYVGHPIKKYITVGNPNAAGYINTRTRMFYNLQ